MDAMNSHLSRHALSLLFISLAMSLSAQAGLYPPTGFSDDFHVYTNNLPTPIEYSGWLVIKFVNESGVHLNPDPLVPFDTAVPEWQDEVDAINVVLIDNAITFALPAFERPEHELDAERAKAEGMVGEELPDLNLFFFLDAHDYVNALNILVPLYTNPVCEIVYMHPRPPDLPTPNLISHQRYLQSAVSNGYGVYYAWTQPGGDGSRIKLIDIEYDWYLPHEDLQKNTSDVLWGFQTNLFGNSRDHGTASVGVSAALSNSYGMKGIVYAATVKMISSVDSSAVWQLHNAINYAVSNTMPGDVILLEQQAYVSGNSAYCPIEYWSMFYAAIANATALDRVIIEPAGNGDLWGNGVSLDNTWLWGSLFQRSYRDSRAVIIGAGTAANRARCVFSNYGSRVDIQGWGDWSVASLGYGDLYGTNMVTQYTTNFSGTSSASALSAGVAASIESYAHAKYSVYLPPLALRSNLVNNGIAQTMGPTGHIGPMPNLSNSFCAVIPEPVALVVALCFVLFA